MSFLAPLFLLGLAALVLPWLLHRFRVTDAPVVAFPSDQFLKQTVDAPTTSSRIRYWVLLLLRVLFVCLVCLWFARPLLDFLSGQHQPISEEHWVVVDSSFSMQAQGRWDKAMDTVQQIAEGLSATGTYRLFSAGTQLQQVGEPAQDSALLVAGSRQIAPGYGSLPVSRLVRQLNGRMVNRNVDERLPVIVHWISDMQRTAFPVATVQQLDDGFKDLLVYNVAEGLDDFNASVVLDIESVNTRSSLDQSKPVKVLVGTHDTDEQSGLSAAVSLRSGRQLLASESVALNAGEFVDVLLGGQVSDADSADSEVARTSPDPEPEVVVLDIDDQLKQDNQLFLPDGSVNAGTVPLVTLFEPGANQSARNRASLPFLYINTALTQSLHRELSVLSLNAVAQDSSHPLMIVVDQRAPKNNTIPDLPGELQDYVRAGGNVFAVLNQLPESGSDSVLRQFDRGTPDRVRVARGTHPLSAADKNWRQVVVLQGNDVVLSAGDAVLTETMSGQAVVVERGAGNGASESGKIIWLLAPLDGESTNLPLNPVFVPFLRAVVSYLSRETEIPASINVGEFLELAPSTQLLDRAREPLLSLKQSAEGMRYRFDQPGLYTVVNQFSEQDLVVLTDARESDLRTLDGASLENWRQSVLEPDAASETSQSVSSAGNEATARSLWMVLLVALALLFILESLVANLLLNVRRAA